MTHNNNEIVFNKEQQEAVDFHKGAISVISSAGSGKSSMLVGRIDNLIKKHKVFEGNILAVSFTKLTGEDLTKKLNALGHHHVNVGTFHAICGRILNKEGINITGYNLIKEWQVDNCFKAIDQKADTKEILNFISYQRNYLKTYRDNFVEKMSDYSTTELRVFFKAYQDLKEDQNLYDFDDYLILCLDVLKKNPNKYTFDYVLVDEHQDSNKVQNLLLDEWCQSGNIFAASDYRQNIYSFRAADAKYAMNFDEYWEDATMHNVHVNYRSTKNIVDRSNAFIKKYYGGYKYYKDSESNNQEDGRITVLSPADRDEEGTAIVDEIEGLINQGTKLNDITVIYRMNAHADFIEAELKNREIDYDIANDSSFFKRREIAGIIAYLRLIHDSDDDSAFEGVFKLRNDPMKFFSNKVLSDIQSLAQREGISQYDAAIEIPMSKAWQKRNMRTFENRIERLRDLADDGASVIALINNISSSFKMKEYITERYANKEEREERLNSIEVLKSFVKGNNLEQFITYVYSSTNKKKVKENAVRLMSIHRSKGLEFENVFVVGIEDGKFPHENSPVEEEARLFYVAITRAKQNLWISEIGKGNKFVEEYGYES